MKRFLLALALVAVAGATYVATAPGSQTAGPTAAQFRALKHEVSALTSKVKALKETVSDLETTVSDDDAFLLDCLTTAWPVSEYGDGSGNTYGYYYSEDNGTTSFLTTGLDFDASGTPAAWLQGVNSSCISSSALRGTAREFEVGHARFHAGRH